MSEPLKFISELGVNGLEEKIRGYLAKKEGADRILPKARIVEIIYLGLVTNYSLFRTEGTTTIDTVELPGKGVTTPVIMPQKITAIARRRLTELLRRYMGLVDEEERREVVCRALELGYTKAIEHLGVEPPKDYPKIKEVTGEDGVYTIIFKKSRGQGTKKVKVNCNEKSVSWDCYVQPPLQQGTDLGMDTYCPACVLFGAVLTADENINMFSNSSSLNVGIKSRVAVDPAFSLYSKYEFKTHQKVSEGSLSTTGMSLYKEPHMVPASLVIGKIALYDVTEAELMAVLLALVSAKRYGGRQSRYGGLKVYPVAVSAGAYERISALELAENLVSDAKKSLEEAINEIKDIIGNDNNFVLVVNKGDKSPYQHVLRSRLLKYLDYDEKFRALFRELWGDALAFDEALIDKVRRLKPGKRGG